MDWFVNNGLIHGDFNEFNLLIDSDGKITVIDFPQMISIDHKEAKFFLDWDSKCITELFRKWFNYECSWWVTIPEVFIKRLDYEIQASGC